MIGMELPERRHSERRACARCQHLPRHQAQGANLGVATRKRNEKLLIAQLQDFENFIERGIPDIAEHDHFADTW